MPDSTSAKCALSVNSKQLELIKASLLDVTQSHALKLQFIKDELDSGRYTIDSECIAHKLLEYTKIKIPEMA